MTADRRIGADRRKVDESVYLAEAVGNAARVWVLTGAKPTKLYTYVENRWVEISLQFNGEENPPKRRVEDNRKPGRDFLAAERDYLVPGKGIE